MMRRNAHGNYGVVSLLLDQHAVFDGISGTSPRLRDRVWTYEV